MRLSGFDNIIIVNSDVELLPSPTSTPSSTTSVDVSNSSSVTIANSSCDRAYFYFRSCGTVRIDAMTLTGNSSM